MKPTLISGSVKLPVRSRGTTVRRFPLSVRKMGFPSAARNATSALLRRCLHRPHPLCTAHTCLLLVRHGISMGIIARICRNVKRFAGFFSGIAAYDAGGGVGGEIRRFVKAVAALRAAILNGDLCSHTFASKRLSFPSENWGPQARRALEATLRADARIACRRLCYDSLSRISRGNFALCGARRGLCPRPASL